MYQTAQDKCLFSLKCKFVSKCWWGSARAVNSELSSRPFDSRFKRLSNSRETSLNFGVSQLIGWILTRCDIQLQYALLRANTVTGSAAVGPRCAGWCVPHVNVASHRICIKVDECINEEVTDRARTHVGDLKMVVCFCKSPLPITAVGGNSLLSLVFSQVYLSGLVPSLDMHLSTMSLPSCVGPSA